MCKRTHSLQSLSGPTSGGRVFQKLQAKMTEATKDKPDDAFLRLQKNLEGLQDIQHRLQFSWNELYTQIRQKIVARNKRSFFSIL